MYLPKKLTIDKIMFVIDNIILEYIFIYKLEIMY